MLSAGCTSYMERTTDEFATEHMPFIQDGRTTRAEIDNRLGQPANSYEQGRIVSYNFCEDEKHRFHLSGCEHVTVDNIYNMVLVYGPDGIVKKHRLLRR